MRTILSDSTEQQERDIGALRTNEIAHFQIESTSRCNLRCLQCPRDGSGEDMPRDLLEFIAARFPALTSISANGLGEPMLSSNALWLYRRAKDYGLAVHMATNGSVIGEAAANELIELGIEMINISVLGEIFYNT